MNIAAKTKLYFSTYKLQYTANRNVLNQAMEVRLVCVVVVVVRVVVVRVAVVVLVVLVVVAAAAAAAAAATATMVHWHYIFEPLLPLGFQS
jgi:hypothetical protein